MSHAYSTFCDEFHVNVRVGSQLPLPQQRETVLHFFEQLRKGYPGLTRFRKTESEACLEEERVDGAYRWVSLESQRLVAGHVNAGEVADALRFAKLVLELAPYELSLSPLEIDHLDLLLGFDLPFSGNHDEIVAESLHEHSPLACLMEQEGAKAVDFQTSTIVALGDDLRLQGRLEVVTRTSSHQIRTGEYGDECISVYLTLRRYWGDRPDVPLGTMAERLAERAEDLVERLVLPKVVRPINLAIASRS